MRYTERIKQMTPTKRDIVGACLFLSKQALLPQTDSDKMTYRAQCKYLEIEFNASKEWYDVCKKSFKSKNESTEEILTNWFLNGDLLVGMYIVGAYICNEYCAREVCKNYFTEDDEFSVYEFLRKSFDGRITIDNVLSFYETDVTDKFEGGEYRPFIDYREKAMPTMKEVVGACFFLAKQAALPENDSDKMTYRAQCKYLEMAFNGSKKWLDLVLAQPGSTIGEYIISGNIYAGMDFVGNYMDSLSNAESTAKLYFQNDDECSIYEFLRKTFDNRITKKNITCFYEVDVAEKFWGK